MIEFYFQSHPSLMDAYIARYEDDLIGLVTLVTGPKGIGLMGTLEPGRDETTYEVMFPGSDDPIGYLTLGETVGIIKYLRSQLMRKRLEACAELTS
jgi:hypothetical protein